MLKFAGSRFHSKNNLNESKLTYLVLHKVDDSKIIQGAFKLKYFSSVKKISYISFRDQAKEDFFEKKPKLPLWHFRSFLQKFSPNDCF